MGKRAQQKIALITGGASGIGFAIAQKFIAEGIRTVITGRDTKKLKAAKSALGDLCTPLKMDISKLNAHETFRCNCEAISHTTLSLTTWRCHLSLS